jgi:hypothetical protein
MDGWMELMMNELQRCISIELNGSDLYCCAVVLCCCVVLLCCAISPTRQCNASGWE